MSGARHTGCPSRERFLPHPPPRQPLSPLPAPPKPAPPAPSRYRGHLVVPVPAAGGGWRYLVDALGIDAGSRRVAHLAVNARLFRRATGIADARLEEVYAGADCDGNGHLAWAEIVAFQDALYRTCRYRSNPTALRPDEFLAQGGGDCEDWALFTCGLLRYWGWNASVGGFSWPGSASGHAVALVRSGAPIEGYGSIRIPAGVVLAGQEVKAGYWIPIDYQVVGGLSNAVGADAKLDHVWEPESLYGREM